MPKQFNKIVVITSIPSYHQVDLFNEVSSIIGDRFYVIYLRPITPGRHWSRLPTPKHSHHFSTVWWNDKPWWFSPNIISVLRKAQPDLLVVCQYSGFAYQTAMYWAKLRKIPFVFWSESPGVKHFEVRNVVPEFLRPLARECAFFPAKKWTREVWGIGKRAQLQFSKRINQPCRNLPYFSDLSVFNRLDSPYSPDGVIRFLFAGRYSFRKGFDLLLEAFRRVELERPKAAWNLTLAGAGDQRALLSESRFFEVWNRVTDLGFLELSEMPRLMKQHDVFLCPSRYDGWGMVVPEALAAGMLVVASNEMGSALDIGAGPCLRIFKSGSVDELVSEILAILDNRIAVAELGRASREIALAYDSRLGAKAFVYLATACLGR